MDGVRFRVEVEKKESSEDKLVFSFCLKALDTDENETQTTILKKQWCGVNTWFFVLFLLCSWDHIPCFRCGKSTTLRTWGLLSLTSELVLPPQFREAVFNIYSKFWYRSYDGSVFSQIFKCLWPTDILKSSPRLWIMPGAWQSREGSVL